MIHGNRPVRVGLPAPTSSAIRLAAVLLGIVLLAPLLLTAPAAEAGGGKTERFYENRSRGQKIGHSEVVWAPSTWEGKKTVHDTSTHVSVSVRDMAGIRDRFETTQITDIERSEDGTLWYRKDRTVEPGRVTVSELTWTGSGYRSVSKVQGEKDVVILVPSETPAMTDAESYLGPFVRNGSLSEGQTFKLPQIDLRSRVVRELDLAYQGQEQLKDESGTEIQTWKFLESDPKSRSEMTLWLDGDGALVRLVTDGGFRIDRTTKEKATNMPVRPAEMPITTPSTPPLERVFSADRMVVEVGIQHDPDRKLPEFPDSPWSRNIRRTGSPTVGWTYHIECLRYDDPEATVAIPVTAAGFERQLEPDVLMQADHPKVKALAQHILGDEKDGRTAAVKLARYVYRTLDKRSSVVAQASALQIIEEGCGDCSEHALLYTTLCRAVGIPARRCRGYVNIGSNWGSHAWCEIWLGRWVGADPTTGEVGQGARYLFFGYQDEADSYPGVISGRIAGRIRFVSTRIQEGPQALPLTGAHHLTATLDDKRSYLHTLTGIEARGLPAGWFVHFHQHGLRMTNGTIRVVVSAYGDQGMDIEDIGRLLGRGPQASVPVTFGGSPALLQRRGLLSGYSVHSRRRFVRVHISGAGPAELAEIESWLKPGLQPTPLAWPPQAAGAEPVKDGAAEDGAAKGEAADVDDAPDEGAARKATAEPVGPGK